MKIDPIALHRRSPAGLAAALALAWLVAAPVRAVEVPGGGAPAGVPTAGWQRPSKADLKHELTPEQYRVTQEDGTEPPFRNAYWNNHQAGIYVDLVSGEPLFASLQKFESGTGWPSFYAPLEPGNIVERTDRTLGMDRTEVRSKLGDSHLGHVFDDGPRPTGLRYCINSASLRFVPVADLEREGYSKYLPLFNGDKAETSPVGR